MDSILSRVEYDYRYANAMLPDDWNRYEGYERALATLERQSSPGYPYMRQAQTIEQWLYCGGLLPDPVRKAELWIDVQRVLQGDYHHVYRAFLKMEPHTKKKAEEGRWRLIIQSSLAVQVAWKMVVGHIEDALMRMMGCHPSCYGEIWYGGGWRRFLDRCRRLGMDMCIDKSAWDWNSPGWVYDACRQLRVRLTRNPNPEWERVLAWLYDDAYSNSMILVAGDLYRQVDPGLMKSGLYVTISDNSFAQVLLDRAACLRLGVRYGPIFCTGDDTIQSRVPHPDYIATLESFGCVAKEVTYGVEFMGNTFANLGPRPMYGGKHFRNVTMVQDEDLETTIDSYMRAYAKDPVWMKFWRKLAAKLSLRVRSDAYYAWFMDSPDALERGAFAALGLGNHADRTRG